MMKKVNQPGLFDTASPEPPRRPTQPQGFRYQSDLVSMDLERELTREIELLPLREFQFQGYTGKRRVISFGWRYDFTDRRLEKADAIPPFLLPLRDRAAQFAQLAPEQLQHVLVTEYSPGAAIGWHRDKAAFAEVIGISLLSSCPFRFRRRSGDTWQRATIDLQPRSSYLLAGPARTDWEHSIPAVESLRYSITWRSLKRD